MPVTAGRCEQPRVAPPAVVLWPTYPALLEQTRAGGAAIVKQSVCRRHKTVQFGVPEHCRRHLDPTR